MPERELAVLILAAGKGTRMKSDLPKVLHELGGRPLLQYPIGVAKKLRASRIIVVVGHQAERVKESCADDPAVRFALQEPQLGTGHAVMQARAELEGFKGQVLILSGDVPGLRGQTLEKLLKTHQEEANALTVLGMDLEDPAAYGRLVPAKDGRGLARIVEFRDADEEQRAISIVNAGIYVADTRPMLDNLDNLSTENDQKEYYLTDLAELLHKQGLRVGYSLCPDPWEVEGINSKEELARMEKMMQKHGNNPDEGS
jgi:UDP-N-acetylglucosamine pyrophosphorylase